MLPCLVHRILRSWKRSFTSWVLHPSQARSRFCSILAVPRFHLIHCRELSVMTCLVFSHKKCLSARGSELLHSAPRTAENKIQDDLLGNWGCLSDLHWVDFSPVSSNIPPKMWFLSASTSSLSGTLKNLKGVLQRYNNKENTYHPKHFVSIEWHNTRKGFKYKLSTQ